MEYMSPEAKKKLKKKKIMVVVNTTDGPFSMTE